MNNILSIFIIILSVKCVSTPYEKQVIVDPEFLKIINQYMNEFNKIPNNCNAKPYYEIYFTHQESNIGFLISAYLGKPGKVPIPGEEEWSDENPIEIKGTTLINNNPVVIYDFI
ncbi:MAG: hypothetical protein H6538_05100, partial [Bacteroidales bacterium]|nr:hypothetical protein [Bacteroidales bacterium]